MSRIKSGIKGAVVAFLIREGKRKVLPYVIKKIKNRHR